MDKSEIRSLAEPIATRDDTNTVGGYAAVFNSDTNIAGLFVERIAPGAFAETLKSADVRAYFDHDRGRVLGRKSANTLRLSEDDKGLAIEIDLPDTSDGRDVRALVERGDVSGMSFGFIVRKETWDETGDVPTRTIEAVDLREVSIVSEPAYVDTSVALRSLNDAHAEKTAKKNQAGYLRRRAAAEQKFRGIE